MALAAACGGGSPVKPDPIDPGPVVNNASPVIGKFTVQGTRPNEPANFADVSEEIPIKVEVTDEESAIGDLKFTWSAEVGTFNGDGASVVWKAPAEAATPMDVVIELEVLETYTSQGKQVENKVLGSTTLMLHDSIREVGEMARRFLLDFSNSSLSVDDVMKDFQPDCYGTAAERSDVTVNRELFKIVTHEIGPANTTVRFGGICPYTEKGLKRGDACSLIFARWRSIFLKDHPESGKRAGDSTEAWGVDQIAAMYYPIQKRWRLCDSSIFEGGHTLRTIPKGLLP